MINLAHKSVDKTGKVDAGCYSLEGRVINKVENTTCQCQNFAEETLEGR